MLTKTVQRAPAHLRVSHALEERIERGEYGAGHWLPTEKELSAEFAVSRPVVRAALLELQRRGLIEREAGQRPRVNGRATTIGASRRAAPATSNAIMALVS